MSQVTITIDGQQVTVEKDTLLIEAAKKIGNQIPHYCYHPGLSPDGNCRMCLVKLEKSAKPVIACKTYVSDGMVVDTKSKDVEKMRQSIMEFLLINHPLDCPTCDQAGECRLQDYYMLYDKIPSRFKEEKIHKDKMVDLGAGVMLDEERCVVCRRCVRFCEEIAKAPELEVQERGNHSMVTTFPGKKMTNPYAGNTIDICPVGALTSKDFRYKKRVWLLSRTHSVCPGCSRGCNIEIHYEKNRVYRLLPRHNPEVNAYWMCDFGRYDYKFINESRRLKPGYRGRLGFADSSYEEALRHLGAQLAKYRAEELAFVASAKESVEEIDTFVSFAQDLFEATDVYFSKNDPKDPFSDDLLITKDKNPNLKHIQSLKLKTVSEISSRIKAVIVQRDLSEKDLEEVQKRNLKILLLFATNLTAFDNQCEVILPVPTYAEQEGHFVNLEGKAQGFKKAFDARGETKLLQDYLADFQRIMSRSKKTA